MVGLRGEPSALRQDEWRSPTSSNEHLSKADLYLRQDGCRKSTLARDLAERENTILLVQDELLDRLFPGEIADLPMFLDRYSRLKDALTPLICALLSTDISVVLDFAANTKNQRAWFRVLSESANAAHELYFIEASDTLCKSQLRERSNGLPAGNPWSTKIEFETITAHFQPPSEDGNFNVIRHKRG